MKALLILSVVAVAASPALADKQKMMQKMAKYNLLEQCWGREAMTEWSLKIHKACEFCEDIQAPIYGLSQGVSNPSVTNQIDALRGLLANPTIAALLQSNSGSSFGRRKRQTNNGLLNPSEEDKEEFLEDFMDFKGSMMTKIGNLSCVLTQLEMLDAAGNINMETYGINKMSQYLRRTPAGSDPAFLQKMADGFSDCYDISRSWPQKALDRHPMHKEHGRHMIFFECAKKMEAKMCTKFQVHQWLETMYGPLDTLPQMLDMAVDEYDAAAVALKTLHYAASDEMKFVDDFFWGPSKM